MILPYAEPDNHYREWGHSPIPSNITQGHGYTVNIINGIISLRRVCPYQIVIIVRKSKDRQRNGQKKKDKQQSTKRKN